MKDTPTSEEMLNKHVGLAILKPYPNVKDAMHEHTTTHIEALRELLKLPIEIAPTEFSYLDHESIDKVLKQYLKELNDEK